MKSIPKRLSHFGKNEVSRFFKTAKRGFKNPNLDILLLPQAHDSGRILAVISAKIAPAHLRNFIRRRLKAIFYEEKLFLLGYDFIIITKTAGLHLPFQKLKEVTLLGVARAVASMNNHKELSQ